MLAEVLLAPDRDRSSGSRPVVSVREQEAEGFLAAVEARERTRVGLCRRGSWHGEWAELEEESSDDRGPYRSFPFADHSARWHAARPIVLHGAAKDLPSDSAALALHAALQESGGLRRWLSGLAESLEPEFRILPARAPLFDPERDLERVLIESVSPSGRGRKIDDLWVKSAWLSTFEGEDSLRVRVAFGSEIDDDASRDLLRHRRVADLAARVLPESALAMSDPEHRKLVEHLIGEPPLFTQPIAYWNAPDGGALFHHDAFAEDDEESRRPGQLGVSYLQVSGRTAWLALSIADLAARTAEFVECLREGDLPWVEGQLFPDAASRRRVYDLVQDEEALQAELGKPACGLLAGLVNRGPEFTAWLADAGHAALLSPGDAILLPNHGLSRTAMHSVFCAGEETAYGLSLAIRVNREIPIEAREIARAGRGARRGRRR